MITNEEVKSTGQSQPQIDFAGFTDDELEQLVGEKLSLIKQRKAQQEAMKMMIAEQEQEFINTSQRNEKLEREYKRAKTAFEGASKTLQQNLKTKEELFVKLQRVEEEIDSYM